jgi:hypothetical protein
LGRAPSSAAGALLASLLGLAAQAGAGERAPTDAEENLPPVGRSLFDEIVRVRDDAGVRLEVPFPFPKLVDLIEQRGGVPDTALRRVLIPLGRSLQRNGASPPSALMLEPSRSRTASSSATRSAPRAWR